MMPNVLVSESFGFSRAAELQLRAVAYVELADADRAELLAKVRDANVLWIRLRHRIDSEIMDAAPGLRAIATATTGLNHIDLQEARRRGITIISLQGEGDFLRNVYATADHTIALALALTRRVVSASQHVRNGGWNRDLFLGRELHNMNAGVIGYGRLGRMVARYLGAFGMQVCAADPFIDPKAVESGVTLTTIENLLASSDLVTLHVALSENTHKFFGRSEFEQMKAGSWFINTARGELIDHQALLHVLKTGRIAGAALDVLEDERSSGMSHDELVKYSRTHDNLLITPHIGGCTVESREKTECFLATRVIEFLQAQAGSQVSSGHSSDKRAATLSGCSKETV